MYIYGWMHKLPVNKFSDMASVGWRKIGLTVRTKPERNRGKKTKPERSLCLDRAGWAVGGTPLPLKKSLYQQGRKRSLNEARLARNQC